MKKEDYLNMLKTLLDEYDAFYFMNKYCTLENLKNNTNEYEFTNLYNLLKTDMVSIKALNWILNCYDCYYKNEVESDQDSAFGYLKNKIESNESL